MRNFNKRNIIIAVSVTLVLFVAMGVGYLKYQDYLKSKDTEVTTTEETKPIVELLKLTVVADQKTDFGVEKDSTFTITTDQPAEVETLKKNLNVTPAIGFGIEKKSDTEFKLTFEEPMKEDSLVRMTFTQGKGDNVSTSETEGTAEIKAAVSPVQGWAFQTIKPFTVSIPYPRKDAIEVDVNTGIELTFSRKLDQSVDSYFSIMPMVEGSFKQQDHKVTFVPNEDLMTGTLYTVVVKEGYATGNEVMAEDYTFSFTTGGTTSDSGFGLMKNGLITYMPASKNQLLQGYAYNMPENTPVNMQIYTLKDVQVAQAFTNKNVYESVQALKNNENYSELKSFESSWVNYEGMDYIQLPETLAAGYYYVYASIDRLSDGMLIQVTDYNGFAGMDDHQLVVWLQNAKGLTNVAQVTYENQVIGTTDEKGLAQIETVITQDAQSFVQLATSEAQPLLMSMYVGAKVQSPDATYWYTLYTDRRMYLPSDDIHVFGMITRRDGKAIPSTSLTLKFDEQVLETKTLVRSGMGTFETSFSLDNYLHSYVSLVLEAEGTTVQSANLEISSFEKPTYKIDAQLNKSYAMMGDSIELSGNIGYYEGTPLSAGKLDITTYQGVLDSATGETTVQIASDDMGHFTKSLTPEVETLDWRPISLGLESSVAELDSFSTSEVDYLTLFPRNVQANAVVNKVSEESLSFTMDVHQMDLSKYQGDDYNLEALKGVPVGNVPIQVEIVESYYEEVKVGQIYNPIYKRTVDQYEYHLKENVVATYPLVTDENGRASGTFNQVYKDRGYQLQFTLADTIGRPISETQYYSYAYFTDQNTDSIYYNLNTDVYSASVGQSVHFDLQNNSVGMAEQDKDQMLVLIQKAGIQEVRLLDSVGFDVVFEEKDIPNMIVQVVYFDGNNMISNWNMVRGISYNSDDKRLNIDVQTDKTSYLPGDDVFVKVAVTDQAGQPVSAAVNISVVDEAFFALIEDAYEPLYEIYRWVDSNGLLGSALASTYLDQRGGGAEMGGEGGGGYIREDFENTAHFSTIETNAQGIGETTFKIPDNLTSWRITCNGISKDLQATKVKKNIVVSLPFFTDIRLFDQYLVNDIIGVTLSSSGNVAKSENPVNYTLTLTKEEASTQTFEKSVPFKQYGSVVLGQLEPGIYTLEVKGIYQDSGSTTYQDIQKQTFEVVTSRQHVELSKKETLTTGFKAISNGQLVTLSFYNEVSRKYYELLDSMRLGTGDVNSEYKMSGYMADQLMHEQFGTELTSNGYEGDLYTYIGETGIFRGLMDGEESAQSTAGIMSIGFPDHFLNSNQKEMLQLGLMSSAVSQALPLTDNLAAFYGLAQLEAPMLLQLNQVIDGISAEEDPLATVYGALALATYGDIEKSRSMYDQLLKTYSDTTDGAHIVMNESNEQGTALMMVLAMKLGDVTQAAAWSDYLSKQTDSQVATVCERLYYWQHTDKTPKIQAGFAYVAGTKKETVSLDNTLVKTITLTSEEANQLAIQDLTGEIEVVTNYVGSASDIESSKEFSVSQQFSVNGVPVTKIKVGDVVTVTLNISYPAQSSSYDIESLLPAGLVYMGNLQTNLPTAYVYEHVNGKSVSLGYYWGHEKISGMQSDVISFQARAVLEGTYHSEPTIMMAPWTNAATTGNEAELIIEPK